MTVICNSDKDCVSKDKFGNCHSFDFCKHKSFKDIEKVNNPITFKVESVMCDYGIFENDQLMMIVNSRANALLIKSILQQDLKGVIVKSPFSTHQKHMRKLRAMTTQDFCDRLKCRECSFAESEEGILCLAEDCEKDKPCKTVKGRYILREMKEWHYKKQ